MKRVLDDGIWTLMCPHESPGLADVWGDEFDALYTKYETEGKFKRQMKARDIWTAILISQVETGTPYMLYKDHCNRKSNQQNIGTIKCSNLCTEIVEYSSPDEIAVCNLASIAVNMFVNSSSRTFDFIKLKEIAKIVTKNLDNIIDNNYYPVPEAERSNLRHRPIGKKNSFLFYHFYAFPVKIITVIPNILPNSIFPEFLWSQSTLVALSCFYRNI